MRKVLLGLVMFMVILPIVAWAVYKPVRVFAPQWVDTVTCVRETICLDEVSNYAHAVSLYSDALQNVSEVLGDIESLPRLIFCSKQSCFESFGFSREAATSVGKTAIVIGPRGWKGYYVRHEMIHHRQAEVFGLIAMSQKPEWLIEGMAYSLSGDPRRPLSERWEPARSRFEQWIETVDKNRIWDEAGKI